MSRFCPQPDLGLDLSTNTSSHIPRLHAECHVRDAHGQGPLLPEFHQAFHKIWIVARSIVVTPPDLATPGATLPGFIPMGEQSISDGVRRWVGVNEQAVLLRDHLNISPDRASYHRNP